MHDDLSVRPALEAVAGGGQLGGQFTVVVDLPVVDDTDRAVLVEHWLSAAFEIEDREAPVPE